MMDFQDETLLDEDDVRWPTTPSAIMIMGKRQGTKRHNKQLWGRIAMAAALWYSAPHPKPYIAFVASDRHGRNNSPDAEMVKSALIEKLNIPADYLIIRQKTNCTLIEVRAMRAIARTYRLTHLFLVTHLYHAARTQTYIDEVWPNASVIPAHPDILTEITFPAMNDDLQQEITRLVEASQPGWFDSGRETLIEGLLTLLHNLDPRGRVERSLARLVRP
ncbi:MAG: ElyC/SanA/YdcF family protein [Anaerolineae bacterium]|nr:ElyC/SanA/YdcF family protein [Anaerolineae bacterium]